LKITTQLRVVIIELVITDSRCYEP